MNTRWRTTIQVDDTSPHTLKPVIWELVRTKVHPPFLKLLVDKVKIVSQGKANRRRKEAYLLWLSDGEKSIQAVLRREIHRYFIIGEIREGSYVYVTKYELASGKKLFCDGTVLHLRVSDLYPVGHDGRPTVDIILIERHDLQHNAWVFSDAQQIQEGWNEHETDPYSSSESSRADFGPAGLQTGRADTPFGDSESDQESIDLLPWYNDQPDTRPATSPVVDRRKQINLSKKRVREESPSPSPLQSRSPNVSGRPSKLRRLPANHRTNPEPPKTATTTLKTATTTFKAPSPTTTTTNAPLPIFILPTSPLRPINRPIHLSPLSHLTGPYATRNKVVDVFAVVCAVTPTLVKCPGMPDGIHYKRELRITDPSTPKHVMLSVFVAPDAFQPAVGTVMLFRSVTTNKWDGGSLNAFGRDCAGRKWCLVEEEALAVPGCDVGGLRRWWVERQAREEVEAGR